MAVINWTDEAERWLKDIFDLIAKDNPEAASRTIVSIFDRAQILCKFPEVGYKYQHKTDKEIRVLLFGHYRIAYLIKPDGDIDILGVFHGSLDIEHYLF